MALEFSPEMSGPSLEQTGLPESIPQVSFDIRLGKRTAYVDFDYTAFVIAAYADGVSPEQVEDLSIHFKAGSFTSLALFSKAHYDVRKNSMEIAVPRKMERHKLNKIVAHETNHFVDRATRGMPLRDKVWRGLEGALPIWGIYVSFLGLVDAVHASADYKPELVSNSRWEVIAGAAAAVIGGAMYQLNPAERRARSAEKSPPDYISRYRVNK